MKQIWQEFCKLHKYIKVGIVVLIMAVIGNLLPKEPETTIPAAPVKVSKGREAYRVCCSYLSEHILSAPSTATFRYTGEIVELGNDEYIVSGDVDAENEYGAKIRYHWTIQLKYDGTDWIRVGDPIVRKKGSL